MCIYINIYIYIYIYIYEDHTGKRAYVHFSKNPRYGPWGNALVLNYLLYETSEQKKHSLGHFYEIK